MKKNKTSNASLQQRLSVYAVTADATAVSLLALLQPSEAEVIYTAVHQELNGDGSVQVDFNRDGQIDFLIRETVTHQLDFPWNVLVAVPAPWRGH
jgi:hypothetical protein